MALILLAAMTSLKMNAATPPAPLFVDPHYQGSCDPEIIWNQHEEEWWIFYTARRALHDETFVATPLGVAASKDLIQWEFKGYCSFDGIPGEKDNHETFWAPAICREGDTYHMFVTWKMDTDTTRGQWGGPGYVIQYSAPASDLLNGWKRVQKISKLEERALDATVWKDGETWKLWYKGRKDGGPKASLIAMQSEDLLNWKIDNSDTGEVFNETATGYGFEEAPFFFEWKGKKWLITDPHEGLIVYESDDARSWKMNNVILKEGGSREQDGSMARHCSVLVEEGRAFVFYHVEPWRDYGTPPYIQPRENRRAAIQIAELELADGKVVCDRDKDLILK